MKKIFVGFVAALTPLVLSLWDVEDKILSHYPDLGVFFEALPIVCVILLALFILAGFVEFFSWTIEAWYRIGPSAVANMAVKICVADDLPHIVDLAHRKIGASTDLETTRKILTHNSRTIYKIFDTQSEKIHGYFCILPLTKSGETAVKDRDLMSAPVEFKNIAKGFRPGYPIYIGGIAGDSRRGSAAAVEFLKAQLLKLDCTRAYARPMTSRGVTLVRRYGFKPVAKHDTLKEGAYVFKIRDL